MKGSATAHAAITIVNALPTGVGCALGISLAVRATATLTRTGTSAAHDLDLDPASDSPLVREAFREAVERVEPGASWHAQLAIDSEIPPARGLKSSSAVASAVGGAVLRALGRDLPPLELARLSATAARRVGLSATGAFDDALAGLSSGFVITDNREDQLLRSAPVDPNLDVALWVPPATHRPSPEWRLAFERRAAESRAALEEAANGRWAEAVERNTALVEEVMGYDYRELRARVLEHGAMACGVSGLGPTLAALVGRDHAGAVIDAMPEELGARLHVQVLSVPPTRVPGIP